MYPFWGISNTALRLLCTQQICGFAHDVPVRRFLPYLVYVLDRSKIYINFQTLCPGYMWQCHWVDLAGPAGTVVSNIVEIGRFPAESIFRCLDILFWMTRRQYSHLRRCTDIRSSPYCLLYIEQFRCPDELFQRQNNRSGECYLNKLFKSRWSTNWK